MVDYLFVEVCNARIMLFSTESMHNADSLSFVIVDLRKVLILFRVEKQRFGSAVVIEVTTRILSNFKISEKTSCKLSRAIG